MKGEPTKFDELLRAVLADLRALGAAHALVGGHAVSARVEPRFTRDFDFAVAVEDDASAESLVRDLASRGYRITAIVEQEDTGRLATVRLEHRHAVGVLVDLLFATSGIEPEVVAGATGLQLSRTLEAPVASVGHLLALKLLSVDADRRPQDVADLEGLLGVATATDLETAEAAVAAIMQRGAHRGRDLPSMLAQLVARHRT